jgi:xylulokinase
MHFPVAKRNIGSLIIIIFFPGLWHQMGVSLSASDCLSWLAKVTNVDPSELVFELGDKLRPPSGLIFLPYLSGERTPHNDAKIRASFVGLSHQTGRAELTQANRHQRILHLRFFTEFKRVDLQLKDHFFEKNISQAVLEGVAFAFRDSLEAMRQSGTEFTQPIVAVGGGSKSIYWLKAIATALGLAIEVADESAVELGAAFGAARLGLLAAETDQDPLAVCFPPAVGKRIEPEAELRDYFESAYRRFRALYPAIRTATCTP